MTYEELIARVREDIKAGKPLRGLELDIAMELALADMEQD